MLHALHTSGSLLAFGLPGGWEWIILLVIGLLIFGRRLPEVGRSVGKSIVEFKKGIKGIEDEIDEASNQSSQQPKLAGNGGSEHRLPESDAAQQNVTQREASQPTVGGESTNPYRPTDSDSSSSSS